ncbi:MAG: hypothetical protein ACK54B_06620, partial [Gemmatimonas sp.]
MTDSATPSRPDLLDYEPEAALALLQAWMAERGEPGYRAGQVFGRLWQRPVGSFEAMSELPKALREVVLRVKANHDLGTSSLLQQLMKRALVTGAFAGHLEVRRARYAH